MKATEPVMYLTFDDGPDPLVTPWVLDILKQFNAKATFFCLGKNAETYPELIEKIIQQGHCIGNHTYSHINGWNTDTRIYVKDVEKCNSILCSTLFRPPYGRIKRSQLKCLKNNYNIIMWSLMSGDFDLKLENNKCLTILLNYAREGSIIVFHDKMDANNKLQFVLPRFLEHFSKMGFLFSPIILS